MKSNFEIGDLVSLTKGYYTGIPIGSIGIVSSIPQPPTEMMNVHLCGYGTWYFRTREFTHVCNIKETT